MTDNSVFNSRTAYIVLLFAVWCGANSLYATDAHRLLFRQGFLFIDLTVIQSITGTLCALFVIKNPVKTLRETLTFSKTTRTGVQIGFSHFIGTLFTNASYCLIGATSTLVWKLSEPVLTVILKYFLLNEKVSKIRFASVISIVLGVYIYSNASFSAAFSVSPILLANIAFPLRNVLVKLHQRNDPESKTDFTLAMYIYSLPLALLGSVVKSAVVSSSTVDELPKLFRNSAYFSSYQIASVLLLARIDALTHAVANLFKRIFTVSITAIVLETVFTSRNIAGFALVTIGLAFYAFGDKLTQLNESNDSKKSNHYGSWKFMMLPLLSLACIYFLYGADISISNKLNERNLFASDEIPRKLSSLPKLPKQSRKLLVLKEYDYKPSHEYTDNVGNWVWQYGAHRAIPDFTDSKVCGSLNKCRKRSLKEKRNVFHYSPMANMFNPKLTEFFKSHRDTVENLGEMTLIIGIGMQSGYFQNVTSYQLGNGLEIETTPEQFEFTPNALAFLRTMQKKKIPMTFRGDFTWKAASLAGYKYGISLGCPSLMINADPYLGKVLAEKYKQLKSRISDKSLKIALNVSFKSNLKFFKRIIDEYPNSVIYAQSKSEAELLYKQEIPLNRIRIFGNVEDWKNSLLEMDLSIGVRIHGNMIALGAGIPVFVISPDHRVLELVQRMFVPHIVGTDVRLSTPFDVAELVSSYDFDADEFDLNRCRTAQTYKAILSRYGVKTSEQINNIASRCSNSERLIR